MHNLHKLVYSARYGISVSTNQRVGNWQVGSIYHKCMYPLVNVAKGWITYPLRTGLDTKTCGVCTYVLHSPLYYSLEYRIQQSLYTHFTLCTLQQSTRTYTFYFYTYTYIYSVLRTLLLMISSKVPPAPPRERSAPGARRRKADSPYIVTVVCME